MFYRNVCNEFYLYYKGYVADGYANLPTLQFHTDNQYQV